MVSVALRRGWMSCYQRRASRPHRIGTLLVAVSASILYRNDIGV